MSCADEAGCFTFTWEIENFDIFLRAEDGQLTSAAWKTETTEGNAVWWCLRAYHRCFKEVLFRLVCLNKTWCPDRWEPSVISSCGKVLPTHTDSSLTAFEFRINTKDLLGEKMHSNIPQNSLTLNCKMWRNSMKNGGFRIHSVVKKVNFRWSIEDPRPYSHYEIIEQDKMRINLILDHRIKNIYYTCALALPLIDGCFSFVNCKIVGDSPVKVTAQRVRFQNYNDLRTEYRNEYKIAKGSEWISDARFEFQLQLEFVVAHHNIQYLVTDPTSLQTAGIISDTVKSPLSEDLLHLYRESIFSDVTINTEGKSFSGHRNILAARSPVFRAMFEKDQMSEGRSGVVDIADVDSATVDRMLVFLYGGFLADLQWEETSLLYYAADKYSILPLKQKCTDILMAGVSSDNVCNALDMADTHSDEQLTKCVVDFICDHQEVVSSSKWEELEDSKPRLVAKIAKELFLKGREK